jgi:hypothetical protein
MLACSAARGKGSVFFIGYIDTEHLSDREGAIESDREGAIESD